MSGFPLQPPWLPPSSSSLKDFYGAFRAPSKHLRVISTKCKAVSEVIAKVAGSEHSSFFSSSLFQQLPSWEGTTFSNIIFICLFGCAGSSSLRRLFSSCGEQRLLSSYPVQASHWSGFSCCGVQALRCVCSVVVVSGLSCSVACGIVPDHGSNLYLLHLQVGSSPLSRQGSQEMTF